MYGKIFDSIFDSTLCADGGWLPTYIFMSMVVLADQDGVVDIAAKALYRRLGLQQEGDTFDSMQPRVPAVTYSQFEHALAYLQTEDDESRSPEMNGRRIVAMKDVDWIAGNRGYMIVNYMEYRNRASKTDRQEQNRERQRRFRERRNADVTQRNADVTEGNAESPVSRHTDTDTDTDTDKPKSKVALATGFDDFWSVYPKKRKKKQALEIWKRKRLHQIADAIRNDVELRLTSDQRWTKGYVPDPTTYLNGERWNDEFTDGKTSREKTYAEQIKDWIDANAAN